MPWSEYVREMAANCYRKAGQNAAVAGKKLLGMSDGKGPPRPGEFCKRWYERLKKHGNVKDRARSGRPRKVPDGLARRIADKLVRDQDAEGQAILHTSVRSCLHSAPELKKNVDDLSVHPTTLRRSLRRIDAKLVMVNVRIRKQLSEVQCMQRKLAAQRLRRFPKYKLRSTVFLDEASLELRVEGGKSVYWQRGVQLPRVTSKHVMETAPFKLKYLGGVLHGVGSVGIFQLTGTTGYVNDYTVMLPSPTPSPGAWLGDRRKWNDER
jgi:hypothetical protein